MELIARPKPPNLAVTRLLAARHFLSAEISSSVPLCLDGSRR